jgi:hypothetical protein
MAKLKKNEDGYDVFLESPEMLIGTIRRTDKAEEEAPEPASKAKADASKSKDAETGTAPAEVSEPVAPFTDEPGRWEAVCSRGGHRLFADLQAKAVSGLERHFVNSHTTGVYADPES